MIQNIAAGALPFLFFWCTTVSQVEARHKTELTLETFLFRHVSSMLSSTKLRKHRNAVHGTEVTMSPLSPL